MKPIGYNKKGQAVFDSKKKTKLYVMYDLRARFEGTSEASIFVTADSEREARRWSKEFEGVWYEYDITDDNELINELERGDL